VTAWAAMRAHSTSAAKIEDAAGNAHGAARYRQRLKNEFPDYVPTGEGAGSP
jgi:Tfp pilus assembly protein PilF